MGPAHGLGVACHSAGEPTLKLSGKQKKRFVPVLGAALHGTSSLPSRLATPVLEDAIGHQFKFRASPPAPADSWRIPEYARIRPRVSPKAHEPAAVVRDTLHR